MEPLTNKLNNEIIRIIKENKACYLNSYIFGHISLDLKDYQVLLSVQKESTEINGTNQAYVTTYRNDEHEINVYSDNLKEKSV